MWVVSYDIRDSARRLRVANCLLGWGERVLESVFECVWRADQMPAVQRQLQALIDPATDRLWLVPVCRRCREAAQVSGQRRRSGDCGYWVA